VIEIDYELSCSAPRKNPAPPRSAFQNLGDHFRGWGPVLVQCHRTLLANLKNNAS